MNEQLSSHVLTQMAQYVVILSIVMGSTKHVTIVYAAITGKCEGYVVVHLEV